MKIKKISCIYISVLIATILTTILLWNTPILANNKINVEVSTVEAKPGEKVEVSVKFSNIPDYGINNCDFILVYDKDILEVVEIKPGRIVTNPNINFKYYTGNLGRISTMFIDETGHGNELIMEEGEFLIIVFKVRDSTVEGMSHIDLGKEITITGYDLVVLPTNFIRGGVKVSGKSSDITQEEPSDKEEPNDKGDPSDKGEPSDKGDPSDKEEPNYIEEPNDLIPGSKEENIHKAYLNGYPDGNFRPENNITRAEAAVIFANLLEADKNTQFKNQASYSDLPDNHWATWAVRYVSDIGLFSGYPDGTFKPNDSITRAEFSTVVFKFMNLEELKHIKNEFDDSIGHWAQKYIEKLSDSGYVSGYPDGNFRPQESIKRAESVALINRALDRGPLYGVEDNFPDVPSTYWAYGDIAKAAITHSYYIDGEGREILLEKLDN